MCLGGHLAYRCALDPRVAATVAYFATDIHSKTLGRGGDDSLERAGDIKGEVIMVRLKASFSFFDSLVIETGIAMGSPVYVLVVSILTFEMKRTRISDGAF